MYVDIPASPLTRGKRIWLSGIEYDLRCAERQSRHIAQGKSPSNPQPAAKCGYKLPALPQCIPETRHSNYLNISLMPYHTDLTSLAVRKSVPTR
jgi:hypothetical protein